MELLRIPTQEQGESHETTTLCWDLYDPESIVFTGRSNSDV